MGRRKMEELFIFTDEFFPSSTILEALIWTSLNNGTCQAYLCMDQPYHPRVSTPLVHERDREQRVPKQRNK